MKNQPNSQAQPAKKLTLKKTSIRVLNTNGQSRATKGPTANCTNPC